MGYIDNVPVNLTTDVSNQSYKWERVQELSLLLVLSALLFLPFEIYLDREAREDHHNTTPLLRR